MNKPRHDEFDDTALFAAPAVPAPEWTAPVEEAPIKNPLQRYYRVPGLHVRLPTNGVFLPPGAIQLTMSHDVPVLPMRAADELLLKSPDALMSGYAMEQLLRSCVPSIQTPRLISTPDLDVLLLAIRAATYGENMSIHAACPKCGHENEFQCHLPTLLATMTTVSPENTVRLSDEVVVYLRPYNMANATKAALVSFEETRKIQALSEDSQELRSNQMNASMTRLTKLNLDILADCIIKVVVPGAIVTDRAEIMGFVDNVNRVWVQKIETTLKEINSKGVDKKVSVKCMGVLEPEDDVPVQIGSETICGHEWQTEVEFDPANFFVGDSSK